MEPQLQPAPQNNPFLAGNEPLPLLGAWVMSAMGRQVPPFIPKGLWMSQRVVIIGM